MSARCVSQFTRSWRAVLAGVLALGLSRSEIGLAQTPFWTETFDNGCAILCPGDGFTGANGDWSVTDVTPPGSAANVWFVSCAENGAAAGTCGQGCGSDASLHVGNVASSPAAFLFCPTGDCGATYDATDASVVADKRIVSPRIDARGRSGLSLRFVFLGRGQQCADSAELVLSADDGLNWTVLAPCPALVSVNTGCAGQGRWTDFAVDLPPSASNNPDLRIGFHWRNNGDAQGRDPSFAVDDVEVLESCLTGPVLPAAGNRLRAVKSGPEVDLDGSLLGAPLAPVTHYHMYRAETPATPVPSGWLLLAGDAPPLVAARHLDAVIGDGRTYYYDLRTAGDCEAIGP